MFLQEAHLICPSNFLHYAGNNGASLLVTEFVSACYWPITYGNCWQVLLTFTTRSFILVVGHMGNMSVITEKEVKDIDAILLSPSRDSWIVNGLFCVSYLHS